jgi:transcriptional regulator with XRE-family HTH domain
MEGSDMKEIKDRIKQIREDAGLNKSEFARVCGVSVAYISFLESGLKNGKPVFPSQNFIRNMAFTFGVSYSWLYRGDGMMRSTPRQELIAKIWKLNLDEVDEVLAVVDEKLKPPKKNPKSEPRRLRVVS